MNNPTPLIINANTYQCSGIKGYDVLQELALNLRWSWSHGADEVWKQIDEELWGLTHNPWIVVQSASRERLEGLQKNPNFMKRVNELVAINRREASSPGWFQETYPKSPLSCVAYFSMEYMLSEALPIYSGGLGNVAGDQLKAASDLGLSVIAVGLLFQQGYFRQDIDKNGAQQALYPYNDPGQLPISPLRKADGEWLRLEIPLPGYSLWIRAWQVQVGRVKLFLLDTNDAANCPIHRAITSELYGGGTELRMKQELLLGLGGWRLLNALGLKPEVCHLNEGHAAFAVLERAKCFMDETGQPFEVALAATRAGNLFTTHTAVPAGFDKFPPSMVEQYLSQYAQIRLNISLHDLLALGRLNPNDPTEPFNMAYLAVRGSRAVNAVSRLHCKVSKKIFAPLFPHWPEDEVPIGYVTNGVHMPSWDSAGADALWTGTCGKNRWLGTTESLEKKIRGIPDEAIWEMRNAGRKSLVEYACQRLSRQMEMRGEPPEEVKQAKTLFDPNMLTLGFARRFATYKRPNMLLSDPERLLRILTNSECPVQLLIAGKAHPADLEGQALIKEWTNFIRRPEARRHVIFISDYDVLVTEQLVQGVDVWVNTPRRPWEACGTSGMKVLVNGGLNLSELDGWWAEAYCPEVGWAIGDGQEHDDIAGWDWAESEALYDILERQVVPEFYNRNSTGIPTAWISRIRESMAKLTPVYSSNRTVREYTEKYYLPAAAAYKERTANKGAKGKQEVEWMHALEQKWNGIKFGELKVESKGGQHEFEVEVYFEDLDPRAFKVELYADPWDGMGVVHQEMNAIGKQGNTHIYRATVPATRPAYAFTPRVTAHFSDVAVPLEANQIVWQR